MKFLLSFVLIFSLVVYPQNLISQNLSESKDTDRQPNFQNYLNFEVKLVDFENSLYVNDFKTTEIQIENGFTYKIIKYIDFSLGVNGGVVLGTSYEDRITAYFQNTNSFSYDTFVKLEEIDWIDKDLSKTRYFIGLHPQLTFNISEKWKIMAGTALRYYFQPFFERTIPNGEYVIDDGVNFDHLGNLGVSYVANDLLSISLNYDRGIAHLYKVLVLNSGGSAPFESSVRYHSLGLSVSYSF